MTCPLPNSRSPASPASFREPTWAGQHVNTQAEWKFTRTLQRSWCGVSRNQPHLGHACFQSGIRAGAARTPPHAAGGDPPGPSVKCLRWQTRWPDSGRSIHVSWECEPWEAPSVRRLGRSPPLTPELCMWVPVPWHYTTVVLWMAVAGGRSHNSAVPYQQQLPLNVFSNHPAVFHIETVF